MGLNPDPELPGGAPGEFPGKIGVLAGTVEALVARGQAPQLVVLEPGPGTPGLCAGAYAVGSVLETTAADNVDKTSLLVSGSKRDVDATGPGLECLESGREGVGALATRKNTSASSSVAGFSSTSRSFGWSQ
jgi:hypothetical protein